MGWAGLAIAIIWPALVRLAIIRNAAKGCDQRFERWTLLNLVVPASAWALVCFGGLDGSALQWVAFGLGLPVFSVASQALTAGWLAQHANRVRMRWTRPEFTRYLVSSSLMLTAPPGLILALLGFAYSRRNDPGGSVVALLLALLGFLFLWTLMWGTIREMRVPGRLTRFPEGAWLTELQRLARRMGAPPARFFLARTRSGKIAGAYCLGRSGVGIADALLASLDMEEFKAVMAHEIWHLGQAKDTVRYLVLSATTILCVGLSIETLGGAAAGGIGHSLALGAVLVLSALFFRGLMRLKRTQEDQADDAAVAFVGALPLISALTKAYTINGVTSSRRTARYRTFEERIRRLASLGGCSEEEVEAEIRRASDQVGGPITSPAAGPIRREARRRRILRQSLRRGDS